MLKNALCVLLLVVSLLVFSSVSQTERLQSVSYCLNGKSSGVFSQNRCDWAFSEGACYKMQTDFDYLGFIRENDAKLVKVERVDNVTNYYYYSNKIAKKEVVNGNAVNVHVALSNEQILIGIPFIYGGY